MCMNHKPSKHRLLTEILTVIQLETENDMVRAAMEQSVTVCKEGREGTLCGVPAS